MAKTISIGVQSFEKIRERDCFYIDKTCFIKDWWERGDDVTLITRPRRFGKTLNLSMLDHFFSIKHEGRGDLFEGLSVWEEEKYRALQGTYPVIFLSFAGVKYDNYTDTRAAMNGLIANVYRDCRYLLTADSFSDGDQKAFMEVNKDMADETAAMSINMLCKWLSDYHGKKAIVLIDEYDTPMQEAYIHGFWNEITSYIRALFNNTFKANPYLERGMMTGITRVSKESIFSDLNNLRVVTTTSDIYSTAFGFTEEEVFRAMDDQGIDPAEKENVKRWYDGFTFGKTPDIYNPWSVTMYLEERKLDTYWANTSGNGLVGKLIREGDKNVKTSFEKLLNGGTIEAEIDEQIIFDQLSKNRQAIWSLLLASGYLKVKNIIREVPEDNPVYVMEFTNFEVKKMFEKLVSGWFEATSDFGDFVNAMFRGEEDEMNYYMNEVALGTFSSFDTGLSPSGNKQPERFYHGFVLGLMVDRAKNYIVKSNRESGFGRYDVVMEPKDPADVAVIMEFKVFNEKKGEKTLEDTAENALKQIDEKKYDTDLLQRGIPADRIYKYGFAFEGEKCLIKKA